MPQDFISNADNFINKAKSAVGLEASKAVIIARLIASKVPNIANIVKSAVDAVATYLNILKNVSLSTKRFCVGFTNNIKCN